MSFLEKMASNGSAHKHIIFIHGLGGDPTTTWQSNNSEKTFWPEWLSEDIEDTCIWSIGYEAPKITMLKTGMGLFDRAQNILERLLVEPQLSKGELIFIGHSLGGLIIKQLLRLCSDQHEREEAVRFVSRVTGVAFLGTPHTGSDLATITNALLIKICLKGLVLHQPSAATAALERNDSKLRELNIWYRDWCRSKNIKHLVLFETKPYIVFTVVKPDSSDPGLNVRAIPIDAHHINISKPCSKQDDIYKHIKKLVEEDILSKQALWLRSRFGVNYNAWKDYDNWAKCSNGVEEEYILDEAVRLHVPSNQSKVLSVVDGLNLLRERLSQIGLSIRLVGLSGVGKTRFVQALFDERIGEKALDKSIVFYSDIGSSPSPKPSVLVEHLVNDGVRAIVIIDNCPPDLHRQLTDLCKSKKSNVSLLTIEYDVREDQPEETEVYNLKPSSDELIEKVITLNFPNLNQQISKKIVELAGGNARVANALAATIGKNENLSRLTDETLFKRLFEQRYGSDNNLEKAAQGLALVYSFQLEDKEGESEELKLLGEMVGLSYADMYRAAKALKSRELAQVRSIWVAILPHPIANRLASLALQTIPASTISKLYNDNAQPRLLQSFSRRLGYLHDNQEAIRIATEWVSENGLLDLIIRQGDMELSFSILTNIAPIIPDGTLSYLEKQTAHAHLFSLDGSAYSLITRLLRSLAYEDELFERCFALLYAFVLFEQADKSHYSAKSLLCSLFQLYLSGTHATLELRINCIRCLISDANINKRELGYELLSHALETSNWSSSYEFDFGTRARDYGYEPKYQHEVNSWYREHLMLLQSCVASDYGKDDSIKRIFESHIRGLWRIPEVQDLIGTIALYLREHCDWFKGNSILAMTLRFDGDAMTEASKTKLQALSDKLVVTELEQQIELYVLANCYDFYDLEEVDEEGKAIVSGYEKASQLVEELGTRIVSENYNYLVALLPKALTVRDGNTHLLNFGVGIANGGHDSKAIWELIVSQLEKSDMKVVGTHFIGGFVSSVQKKSFGLASVMLDSLLNNNNINYIFPLVQIECELDKRAIERLITSLRNKTSPAWMYQSLLYGQRHSKVSDMDFLKILEQLWLQKDGQCVVFKLLSARFTTVGNASIPDSSLYHFGQRCLLEFDYCNTPPQGWGLDYYLEQVVKKCLFNNKKDTQLLFEKLFENIASYNVSSPDYERFLPTLIELYPFQALDVLVKRDNPTFLLSNSSLQRRFFFSKLSIDDAIAWAKKSTQSNDRFKLLASLITPYETDEQGDSSHYRLTNLAKSLVNETSDPSVVIDSLTTNMTAFPSVSRGSRALFIEKKMEILTPLLEQNNPDVVEATRKALKRLEETAQREKDSEKEDHYNKPEERFEW